MSKIHVVVNGSPWRSLTTQATDVDTILTQFPLHCAECGSQPLDVARLGISNLVAGEPASAGEQAMWVTGLLWMVCAAEPDGTDMGPAVGVVDITAEIWSEPDGRWRIEATPEPPALHS
jgi:hypothetical protein